MWICDSCGDLIEKPEDGYVQWLRNADTPNHQERYFDMRLVHCMQSNTDERHRRCMYNEKLLWGQKKMLSDASLAQFVGNHGLLRLTNFIVHNSFKESKEVAIMIRRIHVPGYDLAYARFQEAIMDGLVEPEEEEEGRLLYFGSVQRILSAYSIVVETR